MSNDFDTRQVGEIATLEEKIRALQTQVKQYQDIAEKWEPKITSEVDLGANSGKISLQFGGKVISATMTGDYVCRADTTSATTAVTETLCQSLVIDRLRGLVEPEVIRIAENLKSIAKAGKW